MNPIIPVLTPIPCAVRDIHATYGWAKTGRGTPILFFKDSDSERHHEDWKDWIKRQHAENDKDESTT